MERRRFIGVAAAGVGAAAMGLGGTARAIGGDEPWDNKIMPTGDAALDSRAMQDAANRGGVVRIMSTRGQYLNLVGSTIIIKRSVSIIGQGTKIKYGNAPAFSCSESGVKLSIRNVRFMDLGRVGISAFDITKPVQGAPVQLDMSAVAIGGDEPWD